MIQKSFMDCCEVSRGSISFKLKCFEGPENKGNCGNLDCLIGSKSSLYKIYICFFGPELGNRRADNWFSCSTNEVSLVSNY